MNVNRRLVQLIRDVRALFLASTLIGLAGGLLIISQARIVARVVDRVFLEGEGFSAVGGALAALAAIILARGVQTGIGEYLTGSLAVSIKEDLRRRLFAHILKLGPAFTRGERTGELTVAAVEGVEALEAYFSQYLPQLLLAALIPLSILLFVFPLDPLSGLILLLTAPLIPVFMQLIGKAAEAVTRRQFETLSRLSAHFLDSLQGLTTLKLFGASKRHARTLQQASDDFRDTTMNVLRVAFLSSLVLELVATLSTAVIAVEIGLRLLYFRIEFEQAFFLLLLAPEFYLPLRTLGTRFHAGMSGTAAARRIFAILDLPVEADEASRLQRTDDLPFRSLSLDNLSFSYPRGGGPALHQVSLTIEAGDQVALVGPSGAGKSTLVQLLLRFVLPDEGRLLVNGHPLDEIQAESWRRMLAWVPQDPFIFNASVADNIRLGRPGADKEQVVAAARAAHLHDFASSLPHGYATVVGEGGSELSAGQVQRLSLARAFLMDAPILILDEPTSSLDPATESKLEGSIRRLMHGRTVITIAHRLNSVYRADRIMVLAGGRLVESGTHAELMDQGGVYAGMVQTQDLRLLDGAPLCRRASGRGSRRSSAEAAWAGAPALSATAVGRRLLGFLRGSWGRVAKSVALGAATVACGIGLLGTSSWLIAAAALHPSLGELQVAIVGVRFFGLTRGLFRYWERLASHDVTLRLLARLRSWFFAAIEPLAPARMTRHRSGDLVSRVVADVNALEDFYIRMISPSLVAVIVAGAAAAYLGYYDGQLGGILLAFLLAAGGGLPLFSQAMGRAPGRQLVARRAALHSKLTDGVQGLADLLAFGRAPDYEQEIAREAHRFGAAERRLARMRGLQEGLAVLLANFGMWAVMARAITRVEAGELPGVMLAALTHIALASFEAVAPLPQAGQMVGKVTQAGVRLFSLVDATPEVVDRGRPRRASHGSRGLEIRGLSFGYPGRPEMALSDLSFSLPMGKSVALVGPSGAGKSTLLWLLMRFWEYQEGEILLDGHSLKEYAAEQIRAQFALLPQRPYFFNGSLGDNLRLARPAASLQELEEAARQAQIHEFIAALPAGYDTPIGERGLRLSGGERQRLAIARALLKGGSFLALDEPTANLDAFGERQLLNTIFSAAGRVGRERAMLLITHRLVGLDRVDEILVMEGGRIVERGSEAELRRAAGLYAYLLAEQNRALAA